jgi:EpsI family protein
MLNKQTIPVALFTAVLGITAFIYHGSARTEFKPVIQPWETFPAQLAGWKGAGDSFMDSESFRELQPDDYLSRSYQHPESGAMTFLVAYFNTQRSGKAPHSPKACLPGAGWMQQTAEVIPLATSGPNGQDRANFLTMEKNGSKIGVLYWYQMGKRVEPDELMSQVYSLPELLLHGRTDIALVRFIMPVGRDEEDTKKRLVKVAKDFMEPVRQHIDPPNLRSS